MNRLSFALKNVLRNRRRALVTITIAAVGVSAMLIGGGFALYTYDSLREMSARESGHVILAHKHYYDGTEQLLMDHGLANVATLKKEIMANTAVRAVLPRLQLSGLVSNGERSTAFVGTGVDATHEFSVRGPFFKLIEGSVLSHHPSPDQDPEIMLGQGLAQQLQVSVGDNLTLLSTTTEGALNGFDVRVQGIFSLGIPEIDKRLLLMPLSAAQDLIATDKVSTLSVYLFDTDDTPTFWPQLADHYADLTLQPWWEQAVYYLSVKELYNRIFGLLGIVILAMVFFAVSNTLAMSIVERTREIGSQRAMGATPAEIVHNFVYEGAVIGTLATVCGSLFAVFIAIAVQVLELQMPPPPSRSEGYPLLIYIDLTLYSITAGLIITLCILAAWWSSRTAANRPIVEALTHV